MGFDLMMVTDFLSLTGGYVYQMIYDCEYSDNITDVVFFVKNIFNQKLFTMYDSRVGKYVGFGEYGMKNAAHYNGQAWKMEKRKIQVEILCRYNARLFIRSTLNRKGEYLGFLLLKKLKEILKQDIKCPPVPLHWLNLLHWKKETIVLSPFFN